MRVQDEDTWEAEQWDEYVLEFGPEAYIEERYMKGGDTHGEHNHIQGEACGVGTGVRDSAYGIWSRARDGRQRQRQPEGDDHSRRTLAV